jgi:hypothetical protein
MEAFIMNTRTIKHLLIAAVAFTSLLLPLSSVSGVSTEDETVVKGAQAAALQALTQTAESTHDLAIVSIKAPKKVTLSSKKTTVVAMVKVAIQNRGPEIETIPDQNTLAILVSLSVVPQSTESACLGPVPFLHTGKPQLVFPLTLKPNKTLNVVFDVTFSCAVDPLKGSGHEDFHYIAQVDASAIDGQVDLDPASDICPRSPGAVVNGLPRDKGCGGKLHGKGLGGPVLSDVVLERDKKRGISIDNPTFYSGIAAGDLDGDGRNDIAMSVNSNVRVLLQDPTNDGYFRSGSKYRMGTGPGPVEIGDLNQDGLPDLVTAIRARATISVLLQDPAQPGIFQSAGEFGTGNNPDALAIGDLNGDGFVDIAAGGSYLTLLFNNPADPGTFYTGGTLTVVPYFSSVAIGDLDGDGRNDLAVTGNGVVTVLTQDPAPLAPGSFAVKDTYTPGPFSKDVEIADVDGDGKPDLIVANSETKGDQRDANVSVLLQEHDPVLRGTFQAAVNYETGAWSDDVAVGDLNNDGKPDLAVLNESSISVLLQSATPGVYLPRYNLDAPLTMGVAIADLNEDDLNDVAVTTLHGALVYFQNPAEPGTFQRSVVVRP